MSDKQVIIRPPHENELDEFFLVYESGYPGVDFFTSKDFKEWWIRSKNSGELEKFWRVALIDEKIVGVSINYINDVLHWGMIWELAVLPDFRSFGIGKQLVLEGENLLKANNKSLTHIALGLKTNNIRAQPFYERLGYNIYFLVLHLKGLSENLRRHFKNSDSKIKIEKLEKKHLSELEKLKSIVYWNDYTKEDWKNILKKPQNKFILINIETTEVVGYVHLSSDFEIKNSTNIKFHYKEGFGEVVVKAICTKIFTEGVDIWLQDNHQDIIEFLYKNGFIRHDAEFLLKKVIL